MFSSRATCVTASGAPVLPRCSLQVPNLAVGPRLKLISPFCRLGKGPARPNSLVARPNRVVTMAAAGADGKKTKVLFVCLGNICRSPTAEAVFTKVVEDAGLADKFEIDSCGTGGGSSNWYKEGGFSYHEGDPADPRMTRAAVARGVRLTSRSRPLRPSDLSEYDYILGMDDSNLAAIRRAAQYWASKHDLPADYQEKLSLMSDHLRSQKFARYKEVPDPYYGGAGGFELVLDLLDDACSGLLEHISAQQAAQAKQ